MNVKVGIIDYGLGNLFSVMQMCRSCSIEAFVTSEPTKLESCDGIILPGVGAFAIAMDNMKESGMADAIRDFASTGKPTFGICLGMQLFMSSSSEFGDKKGLDLIQGDVKKLTSDLAPDRSRFSRVPLVGWNKVKLRSGFDASNSLMSDVADDSYFYFVHSYYVDNVEESEVAGYSYHGEKQYISTVQKNNIVATQFHPEKSCHKGRKLYENWLKNFF